jgi:hypothetical protein
MAFLRCRSRAFLVERVARAIPMGLEFPAHKKRRAADVAARHQVIAH